ncbi:MAG TPA: NUDIX domain-containing protein [Thermomicrobiales bacterium]
MPSVVADVVEAFVFRRLNGRTQFLLLRRHEDAALGGTWQSFDGHIEPNETALEAARRIVAERAGLEVTHAFTADYINQFYDQKRDALVLAPVFAFPAPTGQRVTLGEGYSDYAWCERDEATARLPFAGQRWAVRHIDDVIAPGGPDAEPYRIS